MPPTRSACSGLHPSWPWALPEKRQPQLSELSVPAPHTLWVKHFFLTSDENRRVVVMQQQAQSPALCLYRCHQMPHSLPQLCPASPPGRFPGLHAVFHSAVLHCSHFLHRALSSLSKGSRAHLQQWESLPVTVTPEWHCWLLLPEAAALWLSWHVWGRKTSCFGPQNSLVGMFWGYFLQFLFFQQWSLVARDI